MDDDKRNKQTGLPEGLGLGNKITSVFETEVSGQIIPDCPPTDGKSPHAGYINLTKK